MLELSSGPAGGANNKLGLADGVSPERAGLDIEGAADKAVPIGGMKLSVRQDRKEGGLIAQEEAVETAHSQLPRSVQKQSLSLDTTVRVEDIPLTSESYRVVKDEKRETTSAIKSGLHNSCAKGSTITELTGVLLFRTWDATYKKCVHIV